MNSVKFKRNSSPLRGEQRGSSFRNNGKCFGTFTMRPKLRIRPCRSLRFSIVRALRTRKLKLFGIFFDDDGAARGARDAYSTAIVMFLDDSFKMLASFYERIPDVERNLAVRVEGIDLPKIVRDAANNVRHYQGWRVPAKDLLRPELALVNATTIATPMGKAPPNRETVSVWAANWA